MSTAIIIALVVLALVESVHHHSSGPDPRKQQSRCA
jgi:hypothetical protein